MQIIHCIDTARPLADSKPLELRTNSYILRAELTNVADMSHLRGSTSTPSRGLVDVSCIIHTWLMSDAPMAGLRPAEFRPHLGLTDPSLCIYGVNGRVYGPRNRYRVEKGNMNLAVIAAMIAEQGVRQTYCRIGDDEDIHLHSHGSSVILTCWNMNRAPHHFDVAIIERE